MNSALVLWEARSLSDYQFVLEYSYYAIEEEQLGPFLVNVENGNVASVKYENGEAVDLAYSYNIPTIQELFTDVENGLKSARYVKANYNQGCPEFIYMNGASGRDLEDDTIEIYVRNVVQLE